MLSAEAFGGTTEEAVNAALAVELVHAASLVHDDILDQGIKRRGTQSALERFGPEAALLAGDWLISRSIELISHYRQPVIAAFSAACMDMAEGELMDLSAASSADDYYNCISKKTASLFSASAKIGAMLSGADDQDGGDVCSFGHQVSRTGFWAQKKGARAARPLSQERGLPSRAGRSLDQIPQR